MINLHYYPRVTPDTQVTATFDLPGIKKNNAHVSYRGSHLTVTWETVKITEIDEGGTLVREREKKEFSRTIPLPEGTKVSPPLLKGIDKGCDWLIS